MKFKSILSVVAVSALMTAVSSCSDNDTEDRYNLPNYPSFAVVTDLTTGTNVIDKDIRTQLSVESYDGTLSLEVSGVDIESGRQQLSFSTGDQSATIAKDGCMSFKMNDLQSNAGDISQLQCQFYPRFTASGGSLPFLNAGFVVDNRYKVRIVDNACVWFGETNVMTTGDPTPYISREPQYVVRFDTQKGTADLYVYNARFAAAMPQAFNMIFPDIPFTITQDGYALSSARLVPRIGDTPYEKYVITDLNVSGNFLSNQLSVSFTCAGRYQVGATLGPVFKQTDK